MFEGVKMASPSATPWEDFSSLVPALKYIFRTATYQIDGPPRQEGGQLGRAAV